MSGFTPNPVWQSWTPTVTSTANSITTLGTVTAHYFQFGKLVHIVLSIAITTNGTGSVGIQFTLPVTAVTLPNAPFYGRESTTGKGLLGTTTSSTAAQMFFYDGSYPGADSNTLKIAGAYEAA